MVDTNCGNSITNAREILQSWAKPLTYIYLWWTTHTLVNYEQGNKFKLSLLPYSEEVQLSVHINGLMQDFSISNAITMEILQPCNKPSICLVQNMLTEILKYWLNMIVYVKKFRRKLPLYFIFKFLFAARASEPPHNLHSSYTGTQVGAEKDTCNWG